MMVPVHLFALLPVREGALPSCPWTWERMVKRGKAWMRRGEELVKLWWSNPLLFSRLAVSPRSLKTKFAWVIVLVQISLMLLTTVVIEKQQRRMILEQYQKRAFSQATNLAALSEGYLLTYNFVKLEQTVEKIASEDGVAYAIVHLHDGKVAAYSGHSDYQGKVLEDPVSQQAIKADRPLLQEIVLPGGERGYDVAIPFFIPGGARKWGTIRIGFSLTRAVAEIQKIRQNLVLLGLVAIILGTGEAIFLASLISRPIRQLVNGVNAVAQGDYDHPITITAQDEVGYLARRFEEMREALRQHITHLAEEKHRLEMANKMIKETQEQLIQNEKLAAVGKLAAKVAHEVNNPLAIINTSMHLIHKTMSEQDPNKENIAIIEEEIKRIARIIRQLLDFARPSTEIRALRINEEIQHLIRFVERDLAEHKVKCRLDLAPNLPEIRASRDHLKQVLLNLIKNAREAMPQGGVLSLQTAQAPGGVIIKVGDTGIGIPAEHLPHLFEPFFSTKKDSGEGMGLGLPVCRNIINNYGGTIEVESQPGQGTTFSIFLPEFHPHIVGKGIQ
ncbi:MAG: HAMP domain-containing protein [Nitrospinota bacterium]|nr:MAG: HAMP domain-containing protein [Nitrospinota bacterium]